jgi:thiamine biosynthesis lipoprotein
MLAVLLSVGGLGCRPNPSIVEIRGRTMGTTYLVKVAGSSELTAEHLQAQIDQVLESVNDQMSTYRPESEISRFNRSDSTEWFPVSPETATVVQFAQQVSGSSDGLFDVTVAPLVNAWHFGPQRGVQPAIDSLPAASGDLPADDQIGVPSAEELSEIRKTVGYQNLEVRRSPPALRKRIPGLSVDLSAIAKGHGVDRVFERLMELGVQQFFIEIGGEVRCHGTRPDGLAWQVAIETPDELSGGLWRIVPLRSGEAMATSGDYRNYFIVDGRRYSHTINPQTGRPIEHDVASVSVLADNCMAADAWATALNALGSVRGLQLAEKQKIEVLFIRRLADGFSAEGSNRLIRNPTASRGATDLDRRLTDEPANRTAR